MEVKAMMPQASAAPPDSPKSESKNNKQDSRGTRIIQYLARSVSANGYKDANTQTSLKETRPHDVSDSEESDEDVRTHAHADRNSADAARPNLFQKLSHKLARTESSHAEEVKGHAGEGASGWGMSKSVIEVSKGVATDLRGSFGRLLEMKSMLLEKLASMPSVPTETLEHARHSMESIVSDVTHSAYGKTRDAMVRIRMKLVEIIPSLSAQETKKIVDDIEQEVLDKSEAASGGSDEPKKVKDQAKDSRVGISPLTTSAIVSQRSASGLAANMDRLKAWAVLRSRL